MATHAPFTPKNTHMHMHFFYAEKSFSNALTTDRIIRGGEWVTKMGAMGQKAMQSGEMDLCSPFVHCPGSVSYQDGFRSASCSAW